MNDTQLKLAGLKSFSDTNFMERGKDGVNWYDLSMNYNSEPYKSDTCIIVTSHKGHLPFLKGVLKQYFLTGKYVICSFDHPFNGMSALGQEQMATHFPRPDHLLLAHAWVMKHKTYDCDKRNGWFWDLRYAQGIINQFPNIKYVYSVNGDLFLEKPEGMNEIIELLGDSDLMAHASDSSKGTPGTMHTASVLYKIDAFNKIMEYMTDCMKVPIIGSNSAEVLLRDAVALLKLKEGIAPKQPIYPQDGSIDMYCCYNEDSTWKDVLGFRNLAAELETACEERLEPLDKRFIDDFKDYSYFSSYERATICNYWKTGDRRYIYQYWDRSADSWWDRRYYPIHYYGSEPIYKKEGE